MKRAILEWIEFLGGGSELTEDKLSPRGSKDRDLSCHHTIPFYFCFFYGHFTSVFFTAILLLFFYRHLTSVFLRPFYFCFLRPFYFCFFTAILLLFFYGHLIFVFLRPSYFCFFYGHFTSLFPAILQDFFLKNIHHLHCKTTRDFSHSATYHTCSKMIPQWSWVPSLPANMDGLGSINIGMVLLRLIKWAEWGSGNPWPIIWDCTNAPAPIPNA